MNIEDLDISLGETVEEVDGFGDEEMDSSLSVEDISFDDLETADEESLDLSNAVIDEPDLGVVIQENPVEEPSPDEISLDMEALEEDTAVSLDDTEAEALVEEEIGLSVPEEAAEVQLPADLPSDFSVAEPEESLDQVIPEGFVVETENAQVPFDDDIEEQENFGVEEVQDLSPVEEEASEAEAEEAEDALEESFTENSDEGFAKDQGELSGNLKQEIKTVLSYMDQLLEALPEEKIEEFAKSEYFDAYKKLFKELGLV